jgi:hypothetical protein
LTGNPTSVRLSCLSGNADAEARNATRRATRDDDDAPPPSPLPLLNKPTPPKNPQTVNDLYGRLFATWTLLTCGLCLICARHPTNPAIYGATLLSFVVALAHFTTELLVFRTMSLKGAASPMVVAGEFLGGVCLFGLFVLVGRVLAARAGDRRLAPRRLLCSAALSLTHALAKQTPPTTNKTGLSTLWMSAGWNYYTRDAAGLATPAVSAETAPRPKDK